ncbi:MAG: phosphate butyryltransferase [Lachnospiraceae bacterium]|jgi:phosphate butyryltransferase|nr:phosphate butyryltransferase [Lachnospiraceae bacterium]MEE3460912.1 phosphate butyryltransferase [Lachnospiraceae bacterium]
MGKHFENLLAQVKKYPMKKLSIASAADTNVLAAASEAKNKGIADSILVGDEAKIRELSGEVGMNPDDFRIIDIKDPIEAAHTAVKLVHDGEADMYMKGLISSKDFLKSILDKEVGLRTGKPLSHVAVFEVKGVEQLLFLTDVAFMTYPTLEDKVHIINNTVLVCNACGIETPKVAPLAAVEVVNPKMPVTVEAHELTEMNERGEIKGCIVDGPLSLDMAISHEACVHKNALDRKITGDADILLFPDIHAGNIAYKLLCHTTEFENGCILTGTKAPAILTSRSDSIETKLNSIALASVVSEHMKNM